MHKRDFLRGMAGGSLALLFGDELWARYATLSPSALAGDEKFWHTIRGKYHLTRDYINLENGYYSMQSEPVLAKSIDHVRMLNAEAAHYMRTRMADDKLAVRTRLGTLAGCGPDEHIITRNTTESLDTVIAGHDWQAGDEVVYAEQDYGAMQDMFVLQK